MALAILQLLLLDQRSDTRINVSLITTAIRRLPYSSPLLCTWFCGWRHDFT